MSSVVKDEKGGGDAGDAVVSARDGRSATGEHERPGSAAGEETTATTTRPAGAPPLMIDDNEFATAPHAPSTAELDAGQHDEDGDEIPYPEPEDETLLQPPPDFKPFFTLIEDPTTGEHHHPTVHYVFADDDPDILTKAALETLPSQPDQQQHEIDERFVVLDMASDGKEVVSASSLSPDWQALKTTISQAPSWGNGGQNAEKGPMLRITGQEASSLSGGRNKRRKGDIEGLIKALDERLEDLDGVLAGATTTDTQHDVQAETASST